MYIVVGTSFTGSVDVVRIAALWARRIDATVSIVHTLSEDAGEAERSNARTTLGREAERAREHGVVVDVQLAYGSPGREIARRAQALGASLIIVGANTGPAEDRRLGRATEELLSCTTLPLLVLRQPTVLEDWFADTERAQVFCGTALDGTFPAVRQTLEALRRVGPCDLVIEHVVQAEGEQETAARTVRARAELEERVGRLPGDGKTTLRVTSRNVHPSRALIDDASRSIAGIVVVGTHGGEGFARAWHGSVALSVLRHCTTNVLCAPANEAADLPRDVERVLVATDLSDGSREAERMAFRLVAPRGEVRVLHVARSTGAAMTAELFEREIERRLPADAYAIAHITIDVVEDEAAVAAICDAADRMRADVIVLGTRRGGRLLRAVMGSIADEVVRASERPVLIVPASK